MRPLSHTSGPEKGGGGAAGEGIGEVMWLVSPVVSSTPGMGGGGGHRVHGGVWVEPQESV
jgi:hypothetical protein